MSAPSTAAMPSPGPQARKFRLVNRIGVFTLMRRELNRDLKLWTYTIVAPVGQTFLFAQRGGYTDQSQCSQS